LSEPFFPLSITIDYVIIAYL